MGHREPDIFRIVVYALVPAGWMLVLSGVDQHDAPALREIWAVPVFATCLVLSVFHNWPLPRRFRLILPVVLLVYWNAFIWWWEESIFMCSISTAVALVLSLPIALAVYLLHSH